MNDNNNNNFLDSQESSLDTPFKSLFVVYMIVANINWHIGLKTQDYQTELISYTLYANNWWYLPIPFSSWFDCSSVFMFVEKALTAL